MMMLSASREIEMVEVFEATTLFVPTTAFSLCNKFFWSLSFSVMASITNSTFRSMLKSVVGVMREIASEFVSKPERA